ncbi:hypothetical protein EVA_09641 [gut metagenome]|uniref:Uncharacterized protein n=1 Tax=gut metagenome TaxID=749906 RepID=J9GJN8_9ZZZZ
MTYLLANQVKGDFLLYFQQSAHTVSLILMGIRVWHRCSLGTGTLGIDKGKQLHIANLFYKIQGIFKFFFGLPGESHNDIAGKGYTRNGFFCVINEFQILLLSIMAVHCGNHTVIARLNRQMQMLTDLALRCNGINQFVAGILRMTGHKADLVVTWNLTQHIQKICKVHLFFQAFTVAVYILPQKGDFFVTSLHQSLELGQNICWTAATFSATHIRYNAVGAEVVTAIGDGQPCPEIRITANGDILHHISTLSRFLQYPLMTGHLLTQHFWQLVNGIHSKYQIHKGIALLEFFHYSRLLRHTAAQTDDHVRALFFYALESTHIAKYPLLCMFTHCTGVEQHQICLIRSIAYAKTNVRQNAF